MNRVVIVCIAIALSIILAIILCLSLSTEAKPASADLQLNKSDTEVEGIFIGTRSGLFTLSPPSLHQTKISDADGWRVAFDWSSRKIYWFSFASKSIKKSNLNGTDVELVLQAETWGFAVDSITGNIYFHHLGSSDLKVCNRMGAKCSVLATNQKIVNNVAVRPSKSLMFWTNNTSVVRANMDGTDAKIIYAKPVYHFALDEELDRLYWIRLDKKSIASCDLNGNDLRVLMNTTTPVLTAIAVHGDVVYFRNSTGHSLHSINTDGGDWRSFVCRHYKRRY